MQDGIEKLNESIKQDQKIINALKERKRQLKL